MEGKGPLNSNPVGPSGLSGRHAGLEELAPALDTGASRRSSKNWIPAGVHPDGNQGRNDTSLMRTVFGGQRLFDG